MPLTYQPQQFRFASKDKWPQLGGHSEPNSAIAELFRIFVTLAHVPTGSRKANSPTRLFTLERRENCWAAGHLASITFQANGASVEGPHAPALSAIWKRL